MLVPVRPAVRSDSGNGHRCCRRWQLGPLSTCPASAVAARIHRRQLRTMNQCGPRPPRVSAMSRNLTSRDKVDSCCRSGCRTSPCPTSAAWLISSTGALSFSAAMNPCAALINAARSQLIEDTCQRSSVVTNSSLTIGTRITDDMFGYEHTVNSTTGLGRP